MSHFHALSFSPKCFVYQYLDLYKQFIIMLSVFYGRCQKEGCGEFAIGDDILCGTCDSILCRRHFDDGEHVCRYTSTEVSFPVPHLSAVIAANGSLWRYSSGYV